MRFLNVVKRFLGMGIRKRHAFIYPGTNRLGLALVVTDDFEVAKVAAGSFPYQHGQALFDEFKPDRFTYAIDHMVSAPRPFTFQSSPDNLRVAKRGWFERKIYNPKRRECGVLGNIAYRMMFSEMIISGPYNWSGVKLEVLNDAWVAVNSPPRILR